MNDWNLSFSERLEYPDNLQGINLKIIISADKSFPVAANVKLDTGSSLCVFQPFYAKMLGLEIENGEPETIRTATGSFKAFGHEITLTVGNLEWNATVFFAADENFPVSVVGQTGFLNRLKIGLIDYEQLLFLGFASE
jgi:predicted aspartyl protease